MTTRPGWNYETTTGLYQLWPPTASRATHPHDWLASWTERREMPTSYYLDDEDDGWRPDGGFLSAATATEALSIFPDRDEAKQAKQAKKALLRACR